uniref:Neprosin PEP catalytic domain-containing protein n=3 Tax=Solanum tuberosum TaxID=4113 RepID=M1CW47_SOLTU
MKITRMHLKVVSFLIAIMFFLNYDIVEGLTKQEDEALERRLQLLNKPAVKTIKTEYGDIYDCVDFYQQPAFDHPLLKNHTYHPQMKPTFSLTKRDEEPSTLRNTAKILKDGGCPKGTVPIRRTTKEDLIREQNADRFNASYANGIFHFALEETSDDQNNKFTGAGAWMSIYAPKVQNNQWSASVVKLQNGRDQIQAGWRVDPILYGDTRARFFVLFKSGTTQCFNTRCKGFIIVNGQIPLDHIFPHVSKDGNIFEERFYIQKDLINGNWWLRYGSDSTQLGYWPAELFGGGLKNFASKAAWGGEAFSSGPTFPPMGTGQFPQRDTSVDAYCRKISVLNSAGKTTNTGPLSKFEDASALYQVSDKQTGDNEFGHLVFLGGPGSNK